MTPQSSRAGLRTLALLCAPLLGLILLLAVGNLSTSRVSSPTPNTISARPTDLGANLITKRAFPSLSYGIQAFLWWNGTTRAHDLELIRQMRFGYVKQIFDWADVRPDPSRPYDWGHADLIVGEAQYRHIKVVARLGKPPYWAMLPSSNDPEQPPIDPEAFGPFCHDLASRYKGRIAGYQVWNEPNLSREWGNKAPNPAGYVKLLSACYQGIKSADPDTAVISAPLAPTGNNDEGAMSDERYLDGMFAAGTSPYYDALGLNAPGYKSPPDVSPDDPSLEGSRWFVFRHVEDMRAIMVAHGDGAKQVAILEVGWTTDQRDTIVNDQGTAVPNPYRWHAVTQQQQSDYLVAAYEYAGLHWRPWVGLMVTIYLSDPAWTPNDEEYWWAITKADRAFLQTPFSVGL